MAAPICRICEIEPMMGVDYSCTLTHSLSGFRSMKQNRNKERQRATEQFEKRNRGNSRGLRDAVMCSGLQRELDNIHTRKLAVENRIQKATGDLEQLVAEKESLSHRNHALEKAITTAENVNSVIFLNALVITENYNGNVKPAVAARRYKSVLELFISFPVVSTTGKDSSEASGYSTICGIPLPNSGCYAGISDEIIRTALGFIVHLVDVIGVSLNLSLPHPMRPFAHADYAAVGMIAQGDIQLLPLTPLITSESKGDRVDNPNFELAHDMLSANIAYICLTLKLKPEELYPARSLLLNLQLIHSRCMHRAEELMPFMHAHLSNAAPDYRGEHGCTTDSELVSALVNRYRSLGKRKPFSDAMSGEANNRGDSDWLLVENEPL